MNIWKTNGQVIKFNGQPFGWNTLTVNYNVVGAGTSAVNGNYLEEGLEASKPYYYSGTYYIYWNATYTCWCISAALGDDDLTSQYVKFEDVPTPPSTGWIASAGSNPAPTVNLG